MKGNEKDCICHKPKGKHTKNCDSYRLKNFMLKTSSIMQHNHTEEWEKELSENWDRICSNETTLKVFISQALQKQKEEINTLKGEICDLNEEIERLQVQS